MPHKKRYGQHFLHEVTILEKIIHAADLHPEDHVLEIGPGAGALTAYIVPRVQQIIAVEIDGDLISSLNTRYGDNPSFQLIHADILKCDWNELFLGKRLRLISNLPYQITSPLLYRCMEQSNIIVDMVLMLQADVVDRMLAHPGTKVYGGLSVVCQFYYSMNKICKVSRGCFTPPPRVESAVIQLVPREEKILCHNEEWFRCIVKKAFLQRRKTLNNALKPWFKADLYGVDGQRRPETLSVDEYVGLANSTLEVGQEVLNKTAGGGN
ncbi:MAG TPA: 16S rRNA (adenine(1518)-N(6)/adenine(1519)-N(6))-dimethyltransferase RsmA [Gammaproteobacteria bacterium]|nr:16S rRNA (adenine(1518)-N(6)/adenine(1519)-N(6))-dimethyltransferase RsmA [Gammaproteobacteria bacterium]